MNRPIRSEWMWPSLLDQFGAEAVMKTCAGAGVTDVFLLTKGTNGKVLYQPRTSGAPMMYDRDLFSQALCAAHSAGIRVHAWLCCMTDEHYAAAHPAERRCHFVKGRVGGFISAQSERYIEYLASIAREIVGNYDVDGVHLDYIRYNHAQNGWGAEDFALLKSRYGLTNEDCVALARALCKTYGLTLAVDGDGLPTHPERDSEATVIETFDVGDEKTLFTLYRENDRAVRAFAAMRADLIENVIKAMREAVGQAGGERPVFSAAYMPESADPENRAFGLVHYGQDFARAARLFDWICPMTYSVEFKKPAQWLQMLTRDAVEKGNTVVTGVQAFDRATSDTMAADIRAARAGGAIGYALFRSGQFDRVNIAREGQLLRATYLPTRDDGVIAAQLTITAGAKT